MSEDETLALVASCVVSVVAWGFWLYALFAQKPSLARSQSAPRLFPLSVFAAALIALIVVLLNWSASDVRTDFGYLFMYTVMGLAWCGLARAVPPWLGHSFSQDVLHRGNRAAAWVHGGWWLGVMLAFAGGNVGDGPGWWVVLFSAFLSTAALTFVFYLWERSTHANEAVAIDRDVATGMRVFGLLVSCGAILGVAVAGDWVSPFATLRDFSLTAWPALFILLASVLLHFVMRPSPQQPRPFTLIAGLLPMLFLLTLGFAWVIYVGQRIVGEAA